MCELNLYFYMLIIELFTGCRDADCGLLVCDVMQSLRGYECFAEKNCF
jgi:hypothetical protein